MKPPAVLRLHPMPTTVDLSPGRWITFTFDKLDRATEVETHRTYADAWDRMRWRQDLKALVIVAHDEPAVGGVWCSFPEVLPA